MTRKPWFRYRYNHGWEAFWRDADTELQPVTWQGWLLSLGWTAFFVAVFFRTDLRAAIWSDRLVDAALIACAAVTAFLVWRHTGGEDAEGPDLRDP